MTEFVSSGMRRSEFCRSRRTSFGTPDRHLKGNAGRRASSFFRHPVVPVELAAEVAEAAQSSCGLAVVLPGGRRTARGRVRVPNAFEGTVELQVLTLKDAESLAE